MTNTFRNHLLARPLASAVIASCLGLQLLAISRVLSAPAFVEAPLLPRVARAPRLWPFLDYPMFDEVYRAGAIIPRDTAVASLAGGGEQRFRPGGCEFDPSARELVAALREGDELSVARLIREFESASGERVLELRLEREELQLTRAGFRSRGTEVLSRYPRPNSHDSGRMAR